MPSNASMQDQIAAIIFERGEELLTDEGVDLSVCKSIAAEIEIRLEEVSKPITSQDYYMWLGMGLAKNKIARAKNITFFDAIMSGADGRCTPDHVRQFLKERNLHAEKS